MLLQQKLWGVIWVLNLTQMVIAIRKQLIVIIFIISAQLFFKKIAKKPFRGTVPVVGPYSWVSARLDLTQMVMDIQK